MHIFITGIAGFFGSNLAEFYLKKNYFKIFNIFQTPKYKICFFLIKYDYNCYFIDWGIHSYLILILKFQKWF